MVALPGLYRLPAGKVMKSHLNSDFARLKELRRDNLYDVVVQVNVRLSCQQDEGFLKISTFEVLAFQLPERKVVR